MKYLMKDINGFYNADGMIINIKGKNLSTNDIVLKYGFDLNEIKNVKKLINKVLISTDISTTKIKYNNPGSYILINKDFDHYNNIMFDNDILVLVSNDGIYWRAMLSNNYYVEKKFNINLTTFDESKMTLTESNELDKIKRFIDKYPKPINLIDNNNFIKYMFIKLNANDQLSNINTKVNLIDNSLKKDDKVQINYSKDNITITNNKGYLIKTLNVKLSVSEHIKNTISEF